MKFRKKPVVIEAEKISDLMYWAQHDWKKLPDWVENNYDNGKLAFGDGFISIQTLEGRMRASKEDMLILGVQGEIYPCKPDIFEQTYEEVL